MFRTWKGSITQTFEGKNYGQLCFTEGCDLPGGEKGQRGQAYYWSAERPVDWDTSGGGWALPFWFEAQAESSE